MSRRELLRAGAIGGVGLLGLDRLARLVGEPGLVGAAGAAFDPFPNPLTFPPEITSQHVTLTAGPSEVRIFPGQKTRMWTFNGTFPGPTIRRPTGEPTYLRVVNHVPDEEPISLHHHGGHQAPDDDGQPRPEVGIPFGGHRDYFFGMTMEGEPAQAALRFYHDHTHFLTLKRWWMGMAGFFILEDDVEGALPLPRGRYELPLMITDRSFDSNNQLVEPFGNPVVVNGRQVTGIPPVDDVVGATTLVNGVVNPHLEVEARRYRLRVLNAAVYRPYALRLNGGGTLTQIGTESGLQPVPTEMPNYFLGPAQRVELVADFTGLAGKKVLLESVNTLPPSSLATAPAIAPLLQFRVKEPTGPDPTSVPDELRPLPYWVGELDPFRIDRVWIFSYGSDGKATAWTINGFAYDHSRIDGRPELGSTETWALINATPQRTSHYIHLHDVDWYLVSRNGRPAPPDEIGVKETFRIDPGEVAVVGTKFTDFVGPYMLHCHMVNHEDHGMMARWDVTDRGRGDLRAYRGEVTRARMNGHGVDVRTPGLTPFARACALDVLRQISERPGQAADVRAASEAGYATGTSPVVGTPTMYCDVPR